jgi:hypothetical protein
MKFALVQRSCSTLTRFVLADLLLFLLLLLLLLLLCDTNLMQQVFII